MMAKQTLIACHLYILVLLNFNVIAHVIETVPLCGTMDGSPPKDRDKIDFKDSIRTVEVNGTKFECYSDGSNEIVDETTLNSRIKSDKVPKRPKYPEIQVATQKSYSPNIHHCSYKNQTFCTSDSTYPVEHIENLLRKHMDKFADVFGGDSIVSDLTPRIDGYEEVELCNSYEKVVEPKSGRTVDGTELYIFNTETEKQGVRVSICKNEGQQCAEAMAPNGYRTKCKQHYVIRELLSLSPDGKSIIKAKFSFAACCSCALYRG